MPRPDQTLCFVSNPVERYRITTAMFRCDRVGQHHPDAGDPMDRIGRGARPRRILAMSGKDPRPGAAPTPCETTRKDYPGRAADLERNHRDSVHFTSTATKVHTWSQKFRPVALAPSQASVPTECLGGAHTMAVDGVRHLAVTQGMHRIVLQAAGPSGACRRSPPLGPSPLDAFGQRPYRCSRARFRYRGPISSAV